MFEKNHQNSFLKFLSPDNHIQKNKQQEDINLSNTNIPKVVFERKRIEEIFRMLETAVEQSIDGIAVADMEGIIRFCNHSWAHMHGYHVFELIGKHLTIFHTEEQMQRDVVPFNEYVKKNGAHQGEVGHVRKNGKTFPTWMSTTLLKDERGKAIGLLGIAHDITEQKRIEKALAVSEEKYRKLFENSIEAIGISKGNRIITANKPLLDIFGYDNLEEFLKIPLLYHVAIESRALIKERMRKREKGEYLVPRYEYKIVRKDGMVRDIEISTAEVLIEEEKYIQSTFRDISERKKAEIKLQNSLNEWQTTFNSAKELIMLLDNEFKIARINQAGIEFCNKPLEQIVGKKCYQVFHGKDSFLDFCPFAKMQLTKKDEESEVYIPEKNMWVAITVNPVLDNRNNLIGAVHIIRDITERKKTEEEKERLLEAIESTRDAINITSSDLKFIYTNTAMDKLFGYNKGELMGKYPSILNAGPNPEAVAEEIIDTLNKEDFWGGEILNKRKDGTEFISYARVTVIRDKDGRILNYITTQHDVTERKKAEEALRASEAKYQDLYDNAPDIFISVDAKTAKIIQCNKALVRAIGYAKEEIIGRPVFDIYHPDCIEKVKKAFELFLTTGEVCNKELCLRKKDGDKIYISLNVSAVRDKDGNILYSRSVCRDITKRKEAEREIILANERLHYLLSSSTAVIYTSKTSDDYGATFISENCTQLVGYKASDFLKDSGFWLNHIHPVDKERILSEIQLVFKRGVHHYEYRFRRKDGAYIWVRDEMKLLKDKNGNPIEIIGFWVDVTQRRNAEKELEILNKELSQSNRRLKELVLRDSHTGLYNHRYLEEAIEAEFCRAERYSQPLSVVMLDLDYFKSINDVYGHQFGDLILRQFARQLKRMVRRYDTVIRFGGEEFVVISPGINKSTALTLAQRILDAINLFNFGDEEHNIKLKLSLAVVSYPEDRVVKGMDLIEFADKILNKAKEDGGDRVYSSMDAKDKRAVLERKDEAIDVRFLRGKIDRLHRRANQSLIESVFAFAKTIKLKDHYTGEHVENTVDYATKIAKRLNLPKEEVENVRRASMLHDLGKIGISESILLKKGKLTKIEFAAIKKHPQIGADILRPIHFLHDIIPLILYHHERWDGGGYPSGFKKEEIPIGARIVAIADVYQALISDRPYRKAYPKDKAIKIIKEDCGTLFDPKIVDAFLTVID